MVIETVLELKFVDLNKGSLIVRLHKPHDAGTFIEGIWKTLTASICTKYMYIEHLHKVIPTVIVESLQVY